MNFFLIAYNEALMPTAVDRRMNSTAEGGQGLQTFTEDRRGR